MTTPTITTSGCDGHCYCQSNTIGQRYCCKCGAFAQPVPGRSECVCGTVNGYWQTNPYCGLHGNPPR